ncbi:MAG: stage V sporulation protein AC [Clostridia bacterium]
MTNKEYVNYVSKREKRTPCLKNCIFAFISGGLVCVGGEGLCDLYSMLGASDKSSQTLASVSLIFIAGLLTGIGCFDILARHCGAGLLVPITGFSNAVTSPAIESKSEGIVMGVGAEMFKIAGPVIVFGNFFATVYGIIYYFLK